MKVWLGLLGLLAVPASADVSLLGRSSITAMGVTQSSQEQLLLGNKHMRRDTLKQGRAYSYVYTMETRELTTFDHLMRRAEVRKPPASTPKDASAQLKLNLKPNGQKHALGHWECLAHTLSGSMPVQIGPERATLHFSGELWLSPGAEEREELKTFSQAMANHAFWEVPGMDGRASSADAAGIAEVLKRAVKKGMICGGDISVKYEGGGSMAAMAARMGSQVNLGYEKITTEAIPATAFVIPQGYSVQRY